MIKRSPRFLRKTIAPRRRAGANCMPILHSAPLYLITHSYTLCSVSNRECSRKGLRRDRDGMRGRFAGGVPRVRYTSPLGGGAAKGVESLVVGSRSDRMLRCLPCVLSGPVAWSIETEPTAPPHPSRLMMLQVVGINDRQGRWSLVEGRERTDVGC